MPRAAVDGNSRMSLRIRPADKAAIMRASTIAGTDMTDYVVRTVVSAAHELIAREERIRLSERDSQRVLGLLENPPRANERLRAAARALPRRR